jgi:hypothetical protein
MPETSFTENGQTEIERKRAAYQQSIIDLAERCNIAIAKLDKPTRATENPYEYGIVEAYKRMWEAYKDLSRVYQRINDARGRNNSDGP